MSDPLADVSFPRRPAGVPYAEGEDHDARSLLESNGFGTETGELLELLQSGPELFQAAAARLLGATGGREAIPALARATSDDGALETTRVQAAYALARLGEKTGAESLERELEGNPEASPGPLQAAGALAALGDPRGFATVRTALDSANRVTAMIATKQLHAFAGLDVELKEAFDRALARPEQNIVGEARAQLEQLGRERRDG